MTAGQYKGRTLTVSRDSPIVRNVAEQHLQVYHPLVARIRKIKTLSLTGIVKGVRLNYTKLNSYLGGFSSDKELLLKQKKVTGPRNDGREGSKLRRNKKKEKRQASTRGRGKQALGQSLYSKRAVDHARRHPPRGILRFTAGFSRCENNG
jgi:hypothetical protein